MGRQRWALALLLVVGAALGVAIAGLPDRGQDPPLRIRTETSTSATTSTTTTTTAPEEPTTTVATRATARRRAVVAGGAGGAATGGFGAAAHSPDGFSHGSLGVAPK